MITSLLYSTHFLFSEKDHSTQSHLEFRIQELTDENHCLNERIESDRNLLQKNFNDK